MSLATTIVLRYSVEANKALVAAQPAFAPSLSLTNPLSKTVTAVEDTAVVLWDAADVAPPLPASFGFLQLTADQACLVEFTCNTGDAEQRSFVLPLGQDFPLILRGNASTFDFTCNGGDALGGDADVIDRIRAKAVDASAPALVTMLIGA